MEVRKTGIKYVFSQRTMDLIRKADLSLYDLKNTNQCPEVFKQFHITSPSVLKILESNEPLLKKLESHFKGSRTLPSELAIELMNIRIKAIPFTQAAYFYTLSDTTNPNDYVLVSTELENLRNFPTIHEIRLILSASKTGLYLEKDATLTNDQAVVLFNAIVSWNTYKLLMSAGINEINIKPSYFVSVMQINIVSKRTFLVFKQTELDSPKFRTNFANILDSHLATKGIIIPKK